MANGIILNIDTTKSEFQNPMVQLRQGDGNYQSLSITVTSNGEPFDLTGWTTTFMGTTTGGFKIVDSDVTVTNALQGSFTYTPTKAWGQDQGEFKNAYFKFTKADETASGASFRVNVLDAVDLTAEEAGDYISIVDQTISKLNGDLSTLQTSVDDLKSQNNSIKTTANTWTGANTFNESATFSKPIQGGLAVRPYYPLTKITGVIGKLKQYSGKWGVDSNLVTDLPQVGYAILTVYPYIDNNSSGFATLQYTNGNFYFSDINETGITWHRVAKDEEVMHLSGDETSSGFKKFTGNIATTSNNSMINGGGNNGDLAMVKSTGSPAHLAVGNDNPRFVVRQSNNSYIYPTDTFTDMFTVDINGTVRAGKQQDLVPLDKNVVHNTGVEDIFGLKRLQNGAVVYQGFELFEIAPYIDFHYNNDTSDFTSRIMENSKGVLSVNGVNMSDGTVTGKIIGNGDSTIMSGSYGLRVTNTGIQKTSDGGTTWTNI